MNRSDLQQTIYHLLSETDWQTARIAGVYSPPSLEKEGFIHFSFEHQLLGTAQRFYPERTDLIVLAVDADSVAADLRLEAADGDRFPHLYAPLATSKVKAVARLESDSIHGGSWPTHWQSPVPHRKDD